jgi:hypothetical protein
VENGPISEESGVPIKIKAAEVSPAILKLDPENSVPRHLLKLLMRELQCVHQTRGEVFLILR